MKNFFVSIIIFFYLLGSASSHVNHYEKLNYLEYELFRNNKLIGYHKYDFMRNNGILTVKSVVDFKITKLGVDLYKYFAKSQEVYVNDVFSAFSSETKQNKKDKWLKIKADNKKKELIIEGSSRNLKTSADYIVGTWWNHEILKAKAQISAITGRVIEQKVTFIGKEKIKVGNKEYNTLHFNFKSSDETLPDKKKLNTDIWYEENTYLWVKAAFDKSGYWEYRLKDQN